MPSASQVILVDEQDQAIGTAEKLAAHQQALLHRAFSIFIFHLGEQGYECLLQQRQLDKYHSGGLWTNTCCSHPAPDETVLAAAQRRLMEEMGMVAELVEIGCFHYTAALDNQLTENEMDHVLVGLVEDKTVQPNPTEAMSHRWLTLAELSTELDRHPHQFTAWFAQAWQHVQAAIQAGQSPFSD
ncbi:MAG: isopentenyl-diphosphate Delta-isomerase [Legionellales bacterium]|nr:isopentenyl-diphosphate Delta-isomerase [Legionellales bacterium]